MAGSYRHVTTDAGNLRSNESFARRIENLGDAYEAVEEMYGMIWWLAADIGGVTRAPEAVEAARLHYKDGLAIAREANRTT